MKKKYLGRIGGYSRTFDSSPCCNSTTNEKHLLSGSDDERSNYSVITCEECGFIYTTEDVWWHEGENRIRAFWSWRLEDYPENV